MKNVLVSFKDITKIYDEKVILKNINLDIYEKEFVTILGPSGCGKTTLLRVLSGLEDANGGQIFIDGKEETTVAASKREVNTIFQNFALFNHMNVYDNISYGLKIKKVKKDKIKEKVTEMLALVKLSGYEKRMPLELSGGEQQRVAIARALVNNPKVLLLDEPLSSLDLKLKKEMEIELKRLQKKLGITFIFVTHDQGEALSMSDRVVLLHNGNIAQVGTPHEMYEHPKTLFVSDFIGESNSFYGIITSVEEKTSKILIDDKYELSIENKNYKVGDKYHVVIRPENLELSEKKTKNSLPIKIKDNIYGGDSVKVIAEYENKEIIIHIEKTSKTYEINSEVYAAFEDNDLILIKDDSNEKEE